MQFSSSTESSTWKTNNDCKQKSLLQIIVVLLNNRQAIHQKNLFVAGRD